MDTIKANRVIVYHDETKDVPGQKLKGHVLLFVPERLSVTHHGTLFGSWQNTYSPSRVLYQRVQEVRRSWRCDRKLHFSEISGRKWSTYDQVIVGVLQLVVNAMRTKGAQSFKYPLGVKFVVMFYPQKSDLTFYGGDTRKEKHLRRDETILRILLKGASHFLYSEEDRVELGRAVCDGQPEHRKFSEERILWQLRAEEPAGRVPLRDYVSIDPGAEIEHLQSDHKLYEVNSEKRMHANFLQVADLLLGAVRYACYVRNTADMRPPRIGAQCGDKRAVASAPVAELLQKVQRGSGFRHSGHYRTFSVSRVEFGEDSICFAAVQVKPKAGPCHPTLDFQT